MEWTEHIEQKPDIMYGKPVIRGTRIPVDIIIEKLSLGDSFTVVTVSKVRIKKID